MRFRLTTLGLLFALASGLMVEPTLAQTRAERREAQRAADLKHDIECTEKNSREGHPSTCVTIRGESPADSSEGSSEGTGAGTGGWRDRDRGERITTEDSSSTSSANASGRATRGQGISVPNNPNTPAALNQRFAFLRSIQGTWGFASAVINGHGRIPVSIVNDLKPNSNPMSISYALLTKRPDASGHHYLTVNYLGRDLDLDATWQLVTQHLSDVFPMDRVTGRGIAIGNRYNLVIGAVPHTPTFVFPVIVNGVPQYTFTFAAGQEHWLKGSVTHGIVKDSDGEVWLFEEGIGVQNEPANLQIMNYAIGDAMWTRMAGNIRARLGR